MTFLFLMNIDQYVVIPRQKGKTQSAIAILLWAFIFGTTNSEFMFLNKSLADANNNLYRLKQQRDLLPFYMQSTEAFDELTGKIVKGLNNVQTVSNPVQNNRIVTKPSATSKEKANDLGRGELLPLYKATYKVHILNCWDISMRQSAAKPRMRNVQRLSL